jgi:hypothetical protein
MHAFVRDNFFTEKDCLGLKNLHHSNGPEINGTYPLDIKLHPTMLDRLNHISMTLADSVVDWAKLVHWPSGSFQELHYDTTSSKTTLSSICYLNDDYTGGQTYFSDGTIFSVKTGRIIFFDGNYFLHGVKKIESGDRYTLAIWYKKQNDIK